ncbi:GMC family oxidoreductase [Neokomagataea anthophila]|uniref:GMC family oxidoreductase n=1 Tax=Neokomagataea anthophila TaxID=2826925 RepID=A0ABS5E9J5_9PROT|nr:GMC family oxidoreductase [Neokomagataea anthophila]MBR0560183.1 GMC family oxidoreductase [Neokomagataea anthophila]
MKTYPVTETADVVIIGSGAGGAPLAARLAQAGKRVIVLEAGPHFNASDYTPDEIEARELYWLNERLSGGINPQAFGGNNSGTGVGGSLLHYGAFMPRPDPRDMMLHTETGMSVDWPFQYNELLPYIEKVEAFIGVSGPEHYPWDPTRHYHYAPPPANSAALKMRDGCDALGIRHADGPTALITHTIDQPHFGTREACVNCGACHQGCRNGAKSTPDNTWLPLAVAHGAEIRADCVVHTLETDQRGHITGVVYRHKGRDIRQNCDQLVLSAGAVETARLLLHNGLANRSGQVGENYMTHISTQAWGVFDEDLRPNRGYPSLTITEDMMRPKDADFAGGYLIQSLGMMPVTWGSLVARGTTRRGPELARTLAQYNRSAGLGIHGDCIPNPNNRVVLSDEKDALGIPKPLITHSYGPNELAMHAHASKLLTSLWQAAGAKDIRILDRAAHMIGTARMGTNADQAVVSPYGQSFDIPNLWISDHSTFPSATAANPALAIMALSLRTADAMLRQ